MHFDHVAPLLYRYFNFGGSDKEYLLQRLWQNRPERPERMGHASAMEASHNSIAEPHEEDSAEADMGR